MIARMIARYLTLYDRAPLRGSAVGMAGLGLFSCAFAILFFLLNAIVGGNEAIVLVVLCPLVVLAIKPWMLVTFLGAEGLWVACGVYRLLGVQGRPIRASYNP